MRKICCYSRDKTLKAIGRIDCPIIILKYRDKEYKLEGAGSGVVALAISGNNSLLASVSTDFFLTIFDLKARSGTPSVILRSKAFSQDVWTVQFSNVSHSRLYTSGMGHIKFWQIARTFTGQKLQGSVGRFGRLEISDTTCPCELPDGTVLSGTEFGQIIAWRDNLAELCFCHDAPGIYHTFRSAETNPNVVLPLHDGAISCVYLDKTGLFLRNNVEVPESFKSPMDELSVSDITSRMKQAYSMIHSQLKDHPSLSPDYHLPTASSASPSFFPPCVISGGSDGYIKVWSIYELLQHEATGNTLYYPIQPLLAIYVGVSVSTIDFPATFYVESSPVGPEKLLMDTDSEVAPHCIIVHSSSGSDVVVDIFDKIRGNACRIKGGLRPGEFIEREDQIEAERKKKKLLEEQKSKKSTTATQEASHAPSSAPDSSSPTSEQPPCDLCAPLSLTPLLLTSSHMLSYSYSHSVSHSHSISPSRLCYGNKKDGRLAVLDLSEDERACEGMWTDMEAQMKEKKIQLIESKQRKEEKRATKESGNSKGKKKSKKDKDSARDHSDNTARDSDKIEVDDTPRVIEQESARSIPVDSSDFLLFNPDYPSEIPFQVPEMPDPVFASISDSTTHFPFPLTPQTPTRMTSL
ncbi:hypothetical protein ADUPG1_013045, partial [Aduncisulcus paluster]